jgi:hypothetical protein
MSGVEQATSMAGSHTVKRHVTLLILLLTAACGSTQPTAGHEKDKVPAYLPIDLMGQWQVVTLDDLPVKVAEPPLYVTANGDRMFASSQCVWWFWSYKIAQQKFSARRAPRLTKMDNGDVVPPPMCARGFTQQEQNFARAMEAADGVHITSPTKVTLTGKAGTTMLERRENIEGSWAVAALNGRPVSADAFPILLNIGNRHIAATSQCVTFTWTYQLNEAAIQTKTERLDQPVCKRGRTATEVTFESIMGRVAQWRQLPDHGLILETGAEIVRLQPQP